LPGGSRPDTNLKIGGCPEPHDLAASELAAGRDNDWAFVDALLRHRIVESDMLRARLAALPIAAPLRERLARWASARGAGSPAG
jgi:hypothetical protein